MFRFLSRNNRPLSLDQIVRMSALDAVTTNVMIADSNDIIIYMNASVKKFLHGVERDLQKNFPHFRVDELIGSSIHVFHKDPDRIKQMLRSLTSPHHAHIKVGGRAFDLTVMPLFDGNGIRIGAFLEWADASTRILNQDYAAQIAAIGKSHAIAEFDMSGAVIKANENFLTMMGYAQQEVVGKHHNLFVHKNGCVAEWAAQAWQDLSQKASVTGEYKYYTKTGDVLFLQASYTPIIGANGQAYKVVLFAQDVTAKVKARTRIEYINDMMQGVAAGAEQMSASVREISAAMSKSRDTAMEAYSRVEDAETTTTQLSHVAQAMDGILTLIGNITGQINLLALNATIEAARAGTAGRGFAVVANEVKNLANQAKAATDQISQEVQGVQSVSSDVVSKLSLIKKSIENVREYVSSTAAAIEEQTAVSHEISSSMQRAAQEAEQLHQ